MDKLFLNFLQIGAGALVTLRLLGGGLLISAIIGSLLAIIRSRKNSIGAFFVDRFVSVMRGTPLILQLSIIYFSVPGVLGVKLSIITAGVIAFGINSSAYFAEILRSGIESLPRGQFEAAKTLGIPALYMWKDIIMPQVFINIFPAMVNEVIALLKETSMISIIGGMDIMRSSQTIAAEQYEYFVPLCIAGVYYYSLVVFIEFIGRKIENKIAYAKG
jgi:polar amino acid transport system permease protein